MGANASTEANQAATSISYTFTTTSNYPVNLGGNLQVMFNSVQLTSLPPQAYSFGVDAKTAQGLWITRLVWVFGDGALMDIPYCCQNQVSEVQYHAYSQPGTYQVSVEAFDNAGNSGVAIVNVNWDTPVPEYTAYGFPLIVSLLVTFFGIAKIRKATRL
jgi:PKD repeat protein